MRSHAPFEPIVTKFCMWGRVVDVITDAKFYGNWLWVSELQDPPQTPFPILNIHRPYNSVSTNVLHCDYVTTILVLKTYVQQLQCFIVDLIKLVLTSIHLSLPTSAFACLSTEFFFKFE